MLYIFEEAMKNTIHYSKNVEGIPFKNYIFAFISKRQFDLKYLIIKTTKLAQFSK